MTTHCVRCELALEPGGASSAGLCAECNLAKCYMTVCEHGLMVGDKVRYWLPHGDRHMQLLTISGPAKPVMVPHPHFIIPLVDEDGDRVLTVPCSRLIYPDEGPPKCGDFLGLGIKYEAVAHRIAAKEKP